MSRCAQLTPRDGATEVRRLGFPWAARRRNHFLLMTSLWVWHFCVNALVAHRRRSDYALILGWWRCRLVLIGARWVFALRNGLVPRFAHVGTRRGIGGTCQQDQHHSYRRIGANSKHWFRHAVASGSTSVADLCSHLLSVHTEKDIACGLSIHAWQFNLRI